MQEINEEQLDQVIDLSVARNGEVNESYLVALGHRIKFALQRMFNPGAGGSMKVRGNKREIASFYAALKSEKRFMDSFMKHGLDDARTNKSASALKRAVKKFERDTGLRWPFK